MANPYTSHIRVKEDRSTPDLSSIPTALTDDDVIGFGPHKDKKLSEVPISFIEWMVDQMTYYPRVDRSLRWMQVIDWLKKKAVS